MIMNIQEEIKIYTDLGYSFKYAKVLVREELEKRKKIVDKNRVNKTYLDTK